MEHDTEDSGQREGEKLEDRERGGREGNDPIELRSLLH